MYNHKQIRDSIISSLNKYMTPMFFVQANQTGEQPDYPYGTYTVNNVYIPLGQNGKVEKQLANGIETTEIEQFEQVYSFTVAGVNEDQCIDLTMKAIQFFRVFGVKELKEKGVVVVEIYNPQNRDNFLTVEYERRMGFDVRIRLIHELQTTETDYISKVKI